MLNTTTRISLHALIFESSRGCGFKIESEIQQRFPNSSITRLKSARSAQNLLQNSVYDLVILNLVPLRASHEQLLQALKQHETPMPAIIVIDQDDDERIYSMLDDLPATWEIAHLQGLSPAALARRIGRAIENHKRQWELSHLQQAFQSALVQYRNLFDEVPDVMFLCDRSGCLLDANATAVRLFSEPREKMIMRPVCEVFGINQEDFLNLLGKAMARNGPIEDVEIEFNPPHASPIYGLMHLIRFQNGPGRPAQFQGVIKDISPHKRMEQQLRLSEDRYKTLYDMARLTSSSLRLEEVIEQSLILIEQVCNARGAMLLLNQRYEELNLLAALRFPDDLRERMEQSGPPLIGRDFIGRLAISPGIHMIRLANSDLNPALAEWLMRNDDCSLIGVTLGHGNPTMPTSILLLLLPILEPQEIDHELLGGLSKTLEMGITNCFHYANSQEAETRYRELWDHAPAFFISILTGGVVFEVNRTAAQALGYRLQELIGHPFKKIIHPDDQALFEGRHKMVHERGDVQNYELRLIKSGGATMAVSIISEPLLDRNNVVIGEKSVLHDITHKKDLEAKLRDYAENLEKKVENRTTELTQAMNFLNGILEGSTEYAILGLDEQGKFLHFNRGAQLLFGHEASQMVGWQALDLLIDFERTSWKNLDDLIQAVNRQGVLVQEIPMLTSGGRGLTALLSINRIKGITANNLTYVAIARDITEQKELEDLLKLYTENLQEVVEQKTRELDRQHIQLIQSSKLATLGEMATGIAHELHQPLSGIRTRAQLVIKTLERKLLNAERISQNQDEIIQLVDRITHIIQHMRIFARQDQQRFTPFKLTQSIDGALSLLGEQLRIHAIEVIKDIPDELPLVLGEPLQIEQVILNLVSNARDALDSRSENERLLSQGEVKFQKKLELRIYPSSEREVCLEVRDNGIGMNEETRAKVFEPFYTTKPVGRGTGLGLSISYGIVTNHSGRFEAESALNKGTSFRVYFPVYDRGAEEGQAVLQDEEARA